jgi:hypothetical protein
MPSQRFRLKTATIAIADEGGRERLLHVPAGAEIVVTESLEGEAPNRQVTAQWGRKTLTMFAVDILERGERVEGARS